MPVWHRLVPTMYWTVDGEFHNLFGRVCRPVGKHLGIEKLSLRLRGKETARILIAEDSDLWREALVSLLAARSEWQVIYVASDGLDAIRRAEELRPDLVLMDVNLPNLNGFEAARQLSKLLPECKILFVSAEFDSELVQAAILLGAKGYVRKASALHDLATAVETVLIGGRFVSQNL